MKVEWIPGVEASQWPFRDWLRFGAMACMAVLVAPASTNTAAASEDAEDGSPTLIKIPQIGVQAPFPASAIGSETAGEATAPDPAQQMRRAPGGAVSDNGPVSAQTQYRGMFGPRMNVQIDGMGLTQGGPNWMDPPLHYLPQTQLESLEVERGIASVSSGGQSIGGTVRARSKWIPFGTSAAFQPHTDVKATARTVDDGLSSGGVVGLSNRHHRFQLRGSRDVGDDIEFGDGVIRASEHDRTQFGAGYGFRWGEHQLTLDYRHTDTGDSGNPSLPMDISFLDTELGKVRYESSWGATDLKAQFHFQDTDHRMNNFRLRPAPDINAGMGPPVPFLAGDDRRFVNARANGLGYTLQASHPWLGGTLRIGVDGQVAEHDMTVRDPDAPGFFVTQFNDAEQDRYGVFAQWNRALTQRLATEIGVRYNRVNMEAGPVDATPAGRLPPATQLRDRFNQGDRDQHDNNVDWTAKLQYALSDTLDMELGAARKTRSPSHIERYLWLPLEVTAGKGDFNNYVGNPGLDPEVAHTVDLGFEWETEAFRLAPRAFYKTVDDFIQGTPVDATPNTVDSAVEQVSSLNGDDDPLRYRNVEAELFGVDVEGSWQFASRWRVQGIASYVRGKRRDIDDDLYRISPPRGLLGLTHQRRRWQVTVETELVGRGDDLSRQIVLNEADSSNAETGGYALLHLRGQWRPWEGVRLIAGIDNVLDKDYTDHLGGFNRVQGSDVRGGERIPGRGRNFHLTLAGRI